jgi:hypothetical protein
VECCTASTSGTKKHKRQMSEGSCAVPTLSRTNSLNPRLKKLSRSDPNGIGIIDLDAEMDWLLQDGDFAENALMRNMSLNQLCDAVDNESAGAGVSAGSVASTTPTLPMQINLHNEFVVGRAFSYNAYAYNNHLDTPLLGADTTCAPSELQASHPVADDEEVIDFLVDVVSSSCSVDFGSSAPGYDAEETDLLTSTNDCHILSFGDFGVYNN